jgi:hypothetical protein
MKSTGSSPRRNVNVCVAGYGYWRRNLARTFHEIGRLQPNIAGVTVSKLMSFDKRIEMKNGAMEAGKPQGTPAVAELQVLQACRRSWQMNGEPVQMIAAGSHKLLSI